ncbi:unnamed protein product [Symbiodinium microadriaticum]|nr:unnamed protein product [Symbiodinium microadriaticum]
MWVHVGLLAVGLQTRQPASSGRLAQYGADHILGRHVFAVRWNLTDQNSACDNLRRAEVLLADGEEAGDVDTIDSDDHRAAVQPRCSWRTRLQPREMTRLIVHLIVCEAVCNARAQDPGFAHGVFAELARDRAAAREVLILLRRFRAFCDVVQRSGPPWLGRRIVARELSLLDLLPAQLRSPHAAPWRVRERGFACSREVQHRLLMDEPLNWKFTCWWIDPDKICPAARVFTLNTAFLMCTQLQRSFDRFYPHRENTGVLHFPEDRFVGRLIFQHIVLHLALCSGSARSYVEQTWLGLRVPELAPGSGRSMQHEHWLLSQSWCCGVGGDCIAAGRPDPEFQLGLQRLLSAGRTNMTLHLYHCHFGFQDLGVPLAVTEGKLVNFAKEEISIARSKIQMGTVTERMKDMVTFKHLVLKPLKRTSPSQDGKQAVCVA